jgi:hypothetical protein
MIMFTRIAFEEIIRRVVLFEERTTRNVLLFEEIIKRFVMFEKMRRIVLFEEILGRKLYSVRR